MLVIFLKNVFSLPIENLSKEINETIELKNVLLKISDYYRVWGDRFREIN